MPSTTFQRRFSRPAATAVRSARSESGPRNASPRNTIRTLPRRTYRSTSGGKARCVHSAQYGHWSSAYSTSVTGAFGLPSALPLWGIPSRMEGSGSEGEAAPSSAPKRPAAGASSWCSMGHRPFGISDLQQADLAEVDVREGVRDERVEALLIDLHVEDGAPTGRHGDRLDTALEAGHVTVRPCSVEDRPHDVEVRVQRRAGGDDPEADGLTGI